MEFQEGLKEGLKEIRGWLTGGRARTTLLALFGGFVVSLFLFDRRTFLKLVEDAGYYMLAVGVASVLWLLGRSLLKSEPQGQQSQGQQPPPQGGGEYIHAERVEKEER